ncbi:hypothetical protein [Campylobacter sp. 2018MI34]|uniref:hypothetical protein n=1 Tax=Campylobacter sp. 2018MI34 TaxID=2800582 RepID=UPI00190637B0|nr:hypothetical protein [Campylobacter sp. 2018MI34]
MKYLEEFQTSNQISFLFFSKNSFSDDKNLKAWSLDSHRFDMKEWFDFKNQNLGKFYNINLEKILNTLMKLNSYFSIDKFKGINLHKEDDFFSFNEKAYIKIYDRLCQDQSKFNLYKKFQNKYLKIGSLYNFSPHFPFWNANGKNFSQSEINTFILERNLPPFFNSSDIYFNSCLALNYNITQQLLDYLVENYDAKFKNNFFHKNNNNNQISNKNKILEELKDIFLLLCNGMNADYAFMDFTYFFSGYDYTINSKNNILNSYLQNFKDIIYKDTMIDTINEYGKNFFINYYSKEILSLLDKDDLLEARMNILIKNYQQDLNDIDSKGILSQKYESDFIKLVPFVEWEYYVYEGDILQLYEKEDEQIKKYWEKFLFKNTLKALPLEWDCSINEKLIWVNDSDLFQALNAHKILHQN